MGVYGLRVRPERQDWVRSVLAMVASVVVTSVAGALLEGPTMVPIVLGWLTFAASVGLLVRREVRRGRSLPVGPSVVAAFIVMAIAQAGFGIWLLLGPSDVPETKDAPGLFLVFMPLMAGALFAVGALLGTLAGNRLARSRVIS